MEKHSRAHPSLGLLLLVFTEARRLQWRGLEIIGLFLALLPVLAVALGKCFPQLAQ